jgi:outer membrane receptor for ferrienterochelin and colicin
MDFLHHLFNKRMKKLIWVAMLIIPIIANAQQKIRGIVLSDENNTTLPLPGVNIFWEGTSIGTSTDAKGEFVIAPLDSASRLVFSFVGYTSQSIIPEQDQYVKIILKPDVTLQEVVIAKKNKGTYISKITPFQTVTINQTELCKAACCNLAESFTTNPSVDVSYPDAVTGAKQIQMLGLAGSYSLLQAENIPTLRGIATPYGLGFVPGPWMESIQVSKGAASVVNGYESITGQVNVEYRKPSNPESFFFNAYGSDENKFEMNAFHSAKVTEKWSTATLLHGRYYNSPADHNMDEFMDDPLTRQINVMHRWDKQSPSGNVTRIGFQYLNEERIGGDMDFNREMSHTINNPYGVSINNERFNLFLKKGYVWDNANETSVAFIGNITKHSLDASYGLNSYQGDEWNFYGNLIYSTHIASSEAHHVTSGLSFNGNYTDETLNTTSHKIDNVVPGIYGEYTYKPSEKITLMGGLRADYHQYFGTFITPRMHFRYAPMEHLTMRVSGGKGYRHPMVWAENTSMLASGRALQANDNRILENAWNYGASANYILRIGSREVEFNAEYFRTDFINQMVVDMESSTANILVTELDDRSYANSYQIDTRFETLPRLDITAAIRFNDVKQSIGGQLMDKALSSKYKGLVTLNYSDRLKKWVFDFTTQFIGKGRIPQVPGATGEYYVPASFDAYTLMNAQVTRFFRNGSVYLGCENLTDFTQKRPVIGSSDPYNTSFDATRVWGPVMGRMFYMGVRLTINKED